MICSCFLESANLQSLTGGQDRPSHLPGQEKQESFAPAFTQFSTGPADLGDDLALQVPHTGASPLTLKSPMPGGPNLNPEPYRARAQPQSPGDLVYTLARCPYRP
jgi:hypothetical protein